MQQDKSSQNPSAQDANKVSAATTITDSHNTPSPSNETNAPVNPNQPFIDMEKKWLDHWYSTGITEKYLSKNDFNTQTFSFMDGPITANNPMGVHHAWGRSYKDLFQKFHNLLGHRQRFRNGFDCQGLWVEVEVEKELGLKTKKDIENLVPGDPSASIAKFVQLCKDRVMKFSGIQTQQSQRLGYFMDWDNSYYTMSSENNFMIWHFIKTCNDHGWVYKGHDSVPWCPRCGTAISQHEMLTEDYSEIQHETVFFQLKIKNNDFGTGQQVYFLAWTTTPWTVPGNVALAVNKEIDYVLVKVTGTPAGSLHPDETKETYLILAESRLKDSIKETHEVIKKFKGEELIGTKYDAAFDAFPRVMEARDAHPDTFHTVVDGTEIVSEGEGTGILHVAPGQGQEDFTLGKKERLSVIELIGEDASYYDGLNEFSGQNAKEKPGIIFKFLKEQNGGAFFYKTQSYKHRYPRCWRCKTELVWRVVDEWYIAMDKVSEMDHNDKRTLRERMVDVAKQIRWIPGFGLDRELDWLKNMHDWLISKKRFWGLALPIWVSEDGSEFEVIGSEEELQERAIDGWDKYEGHTPHRPYVDHIKIKSKKTGQTMHRIPDVGNPWLDAGIVPFSTIQDPETGKLAYLENPEYFKQWFPVDFITESFPGQFKNWFYAMIAMSTVLEDSNPYKTVLGFGTLKAEDGRAMHKSWGNSIEFNEGADSIGVDVMRWMYARQNPADDMRFGYRNANEVRRQFYLMLWNVFKFLNEYAKLDGINVKELNPHITSRDSKIEADVSAMNDSDNVLDRWILARLRQVTKQGFDALNSYDPRGYAMPIEEFVNDLSTWYLRRSRDRVWISAESADDKNDFYGTLHAVLTHLSVILSPVLPFITEEMYTKLTGAESVHLASWPEMSGYEATSAEDVQYVTDMIMVRAGVEAGHRVRKEQKLKVKQPLASVQINLPKNQGFQITEMIPQYTRLIAEELNVKEVKLGVSETDEATAKYDTNLTDELIQEGKLRELLRSIQGERKKMGASLDQKVVLTIPEEYKGHEEQIMKAVLTERIEYGAEIKVELV